MFILKNHIDKKGIIVVAAIFISLFCSYPYTFPRFFPTPPLTIVIVFELVSLALVCLTLKRKKTLPKTFAIICLLQILIFVALAIWHRDIFYLMRFALYVVLTYFSLYIVHNTIGISKFVTINNVWITIQAVLSVVGFVLIVANIIHPLMVYYFEDSYGVDYFYGITTTNAIIGIIPRIAGYFDEPGAFAQWGMYALVLNKISPCYNKRIELILIFGLVFTFSLAYFLQLTLYLVLFNYKYIKKFVLVLVVLAGLVVISSKLIPEDSDLYFLTLRRFDMNAETNRDEPSKVAKAFFYKNPILGAGYTKLADSGVYFWDNPYETLASSGIVGAFALYLPLIVILLRYRKKSALPAVIILSVGYLQRPFHIQYIHYLMMYLLFLDCYYLNMRVSIKKKYEE